METLSRKTIVYIYLDSKIVKSPKENKNLHAHTEDEVKSQLREAITNVAEKRANRKRSQNTCCYGNVAWGSHNGGRVPKLELEGDNNVKIDWKEKDDETIWVNVDIDEDRMNVDCSNLMKKVLFCKAIASFYKKLRFI